MPRYLQPKKMIQIKEGVQKAEDASSKPAPNTSKAKLVLKEIDSKTIEMENNRVNPSTVFSIFYVTNAQ